MESKDQYKQTNRKRLIDTEKRHTVAREERAVGQGEKSEGIEKYRVVVTK